MPDRSSMDDIPPIIPARDEVVPRRSGKKPRGRSEQGAGNGGGTGLWARLFIVVAIVVAAVACAWAWQLQQELDGADVALADYEARISDLEDRLSDTDEGVTQSSAALAVKIKELYSEVDKLWASAWRTNKAKIAALEKSSKSQGSRVATLGKTDKDTSAQLTALNEDIGKLRTVAGDLERLLTNAKTNQAQLERLADDINRLTLEGARLNKRVAANEEWVESINGFRKQVNRTLSELQAPPGG
jgi:chromosome segregation ATPase